MVGARRTWSTLLLIALVATASAMVWRHFQPLLLRHNQYRITAQHIEITTPPPWIQADVRAEVVRDASLDEQTSLLENDVTRRIAEAFRFHPWVADVRRVTLHYGPRVQVDLVYRKPVALVQTDGDHLVPADMRGVRLPSDGLLANPTSRYPVLAGTAARPLVGQRFDDPDLLGGLRLAALLLPNWPQLGLNQIRLARPAVDRPTHSPADYELVASNGNRVRWGPAPTELVPSQPRDKQKLARLLEWAKKEGTGTAPAIDEPIDLRLDAAAKQGDVPR